MHNALRRIALILLLLGLVAVSLAACDDEPSDALGPGIWVAVVQPAADLSQDALFTAPIRVLDAVSRVERTFGPASYYIIVRWSPAGDRLAALDLEYKPDDSSRIHLRMWDAGGRVIMDRSYDDGDVTRFIDRLDWSPDGTRLAATSAGGVTMFDASGRELGVAHATPTALGGGGGRIGSDRRVSLWSPDSRHFVTPVNGLLLVSDRDGHGGEFDLPETPRTADMQFDGWRGPDTIAMFSRSFSADTNPTASTFTGVVSSTKIAWDGGVAADFSAGYPTGPEIEAYAQLLPGRIWSGDFRSADGAAKVVRLVGQTADRLAPSPFALDLEFDGKTVVIDLGLANTRSNRDGIDVILRPGWKGSLPAVVNAAKPLPSPSARPTEKPSPTPSGPATPYPDRGPDYPAPRGERVSPQVADLPVFPGSHEIDGFVAKGLGITGNVQMLSAVAGEREILDFFEEQLVAKGFRKESNSKSPLGEQFSYTKGRDRVVISTAYIERPEERRPTTEIPYGFQGKGNRFVSTINGETFFYVVTLHAPQPR